MIMEPINSWGRLASPSLSVDLGNAKVTPSKPAPNPIQQWNHCLQLCLSRVPANPGYNSRVFLPEGLQQPLPAGAKRVRACRKTSVPRSVSSPDKTQQV